MGKRIGALFTDRENGVTVRVERVTEHGARITVLSKLTSSWFMPLAEYDTVFVKRFIPLDVGEMESPVEYRPPANAAYWEEEAAREAADPVLTEARASVALDGETQSVEEVTLGEPPATSPEPVDRVGHHGSVQPDDIALQVSDRHRAAGGGGHPGWRRHDRFGVHDRRQLPGEGAAGWYDRDGTRALARAGRQARCGSARGCLSASSDSSASAAVAGGTGSRASSIRVPTRPGVGGCWLG